MFIPQLTLLLAAFGQPHEASAQHAYQATQVHMGVPFKIVLHAPSEAAAKRGFDAAFRRIERLDNILSDYDPESELSRLNRTAPSEHPVSVGSDLWAVLHYAQSLSKQSDGAFDVTVGPLSRLWRRARRQRELPSSEMLDEARAATGYAFLRLDEERQTAQLLQPNMRLDLGGIAKGYAADEALAELRAAGLSSALVDASGDMAFGDAPPDKPGWQVGIAPLNADDPPSRFLHLSNCGIATSGDAWQYVEIDGQRYSHIVDPRTGLGLTDRSSVTVIAADGISADALASAVSVLGPRAGIALIDAIDSAAALIVRAPHGDVETFESRRFEQFLAGQPRRAE